MIDADLHNEPPSLQALYPYLPDHWVDYCNESAFVGPDASDYPKNAPITARPNSKPADGPPGSDLDILRQQALDTTNTEIGILNCAYRVASVHNQDLAASLATAVNHWQVDEWLDKEPRLRASIVVPSQNPERAAAEIERWGDHPGFVQVILPVRSEAPYGNLRYDPIYAAAARHDLVVGIHYGGAPGHPSTPSGWALTYLEEYAGMAQVFQSQLISLIIEGVFDRFPTLRMAMIEGGWTWLPSLCWRIDKEWKGLRHNTPWVRRPPSAYVREHMRFSWLPLDAPPTTSQFLQVIEQLESEDLLLFATDYPHWHFDTLEEIMPASLPDSLRRKILAENARSFYRL
jgi:predicted TIM-barrel fold metal-dependent hydrolase